MAKCVAFEKEVYDTIRAQPFTKIPTKPSWVHKEPMIEEACQIALDINVSYTWTGEDVFLAEMGGAT